MCEILSLAKLEITQNVITFSSIDMMDNFLKYVRKSVFLILITNSFIIFFRKIISEGLSILIYLSYLTKNIAISIMISYSLSKFKKHLTVASCTTILNLSLGVYLL